MFAHTNHIFMMPAHKRPLNSYKPLGKKITPCPSPSKRHADTPTPTPQYWPNFQLVPEDVQCSETCKNNF